MRGYNAAFLPRLGSCFKLFKVAATFDGAKLMFATPVSKDSVLAKLW
jgi:hypothetical protein